MLDFIFARNTASVLSSFQRILTRLEIVMARFEQKVVKAEKRKQRAEVAAELQYQRTLECQREIARAKEAHEKISKLLP